MILRSTDIRAALRSRQRGLLLNPFRFGGGGGPTDPNFSNVSSLLHFDGSDGSTTFTDQKGVSWSVNGNAQIDTAQSVFGGASGLFDGSGDWIQAADSAAWQFGSGSFTVECRYRTANASADQAIFTYGAATISGGANIGWALSHFGASLAGKVRGFFYQGTTQYLVDTTTALAADTWYALRFERDGSTLAIYVNGTREATLALGGGVSVNTGTFNLRIGRYETTTTRYLNGHVDEARITKGVARTSSGASYVVDTSPFPDA